jgi:hypothetical protein
MQSVGTWHISSTLWRRSLRKTHWCHACRRYLATLVEGQDAVTILEVDAAACKLALRQCITIHDLALPTAVQVDCWPPLSPIRADLLFCVICQLRTRDNSLLHK